MIRLTLPDGTVKEFDAPVTGAEVAASIGAGLAKVALAIKVNDDLLDLCCEITTDASVAIITAKDPTGIEIIRHSCAHLLAQAVKELFPKAQVTIGPVIEDGFYYDFAYEESFTPENMVAIEAKMKALAKEGLTVTRHTKSREEAIQFFEDIGEVYKAEIIRDIPAGETLSLYQQGNFIDLCRGPHIPNTSHIKAFKLTKLAGAYWRGDSNNEMLQRIYGTAWPDKQALKDYLHRLAEAEKRDHRKLGKELHWFHTQEEAPGMAFWHPTGWLVYQIIEQYIRTKLQDYHYHEVRTPQMMDRSLWEKSGHWDKFRNEMFTTETENREYAIKPMNCPGHIQIYKQGLKSYRDLPLRIAEFGLVHRSEPSGTLHGLLRVRQFVQDDAHVFCTEEQIQSEVEQCINLLYDIYQDFGFKEVTVKLSTRPDKRVGDDAIWDKAEEALEQALNAKKLDWELFPGEGAFYGPKIEFSLRDCLGRVWQLGTIQLDFSMPARLDAHYIAEDGSKRVPVMVHRAILGSMERFIAILLEHYAGKMPLWLAPFQVSLLTITDSQAEYAKKLLESMCKSGIRAKIDLRNEKIGFKIREHTLARVPYLVVLGDREVASEQLAVRTLNGNDLGTMDLASFCDLVTEKVASKATEV